MAFWVWFRRTWLTCTDVTVLMWLINTFWWAWSQRAKLQFVVWQCVNVQRMVNTLEKNAWINKGGRTCSAMHQRFYWLTEHIHSVKVEQRRTLTYQYAGVHWRLHRNKIPILKFVCRDYYLFSLIYQKLVMGPDERLSDRVLPFFDAWYSTLIAQHQCPS